MGEVGRGSQPEQSAGKGVLREPGILGAAGHFRQACESLATAGGRAMGGAQAWACLASTAAVVWRHLLTLGLTSS